jgi:DNA repair exonuclease SbcCD ATPase subunit
VATDLETSRSRSELDMSLNRSDRPAQAGPTTPVLAEVLHQAAGAVRPAPEEDEKRLSVFWRVFGGTILSIAALVAVTVYQQLGNTLNDLRGELSHLNEDLRKEMNRLSENQGELVPKEDFAGKQRYISDTLKELQSDRSAMTALKERSAVLMDLYKTNEEDQKELRRTLEHLHEQKASEEERRQLVQELQALRQRLATLEGKPTTLSTPAEPALMKEVEE